MDLNKIIFINNMILNNSYNIKMKIFVSYVFIMKKIKI